MASRRPSKARKPPSRQRLWQIEMQKKGLCARCATKRKKYAWLCDACQVKQRGYMRKYLGLDVKAKGKGGRPTDKRRAA